MATETWDSEASGGRMDHLAGALRAAGIEAAPQTAMFSMPAMFDIAYRRPGGTAADRATPAAAAIPEQRGASVREQLLRGADASTTVST
jgi:hypothetical protein